MNNQEIAVEAVAEAYSILQKLAHADDSRWATDSVPLRALTRLAEQLGYVDLEELCSCSHKYSHSFDEDGW